MKREVQKSERFFIMASVLGLLALATLPLDQPLMAAAGGQQSTVNHPTTMGLTGDLVIAKLLERNRMREARLQQYSVPSTYRVKNDKGKVRAEAQVVLRFRAPDTKEFKIVSETGSGLIRSRVFKPLMEIEVETAAGRHRHDSSITSNNYIFKLLGEEDVDGAHCFVVQTTAKRADKVSVQWESLDPRRGVCVRSSCGPARQKPIGLDQTRGIRAALSEDQRILVAAQKRINYASPNLWEKHFDN